jgi:hypothetical protein
MVLCRVRQGAAFLYRSSNLHTDATRQNRLPRRRCPVLFPEELFLQDAHDLRVNLAENHITNWKPEYSLRNASISCNVLDKECKTGNEFNNPVSHYMAV